MSFGHFKRGCKRLLILALTLTLALPAGASAAHWHAEAYSFTVLMLGDSQIAGAGWDGGYANLIEEYYPDAEVCNLGKHGSRLYNDKILGQWRWYASQDDLPMPDFVLLDGGTVDLNFLKMENFDDEGLAWILYSLEKLLEEIHKTSPDTQIIYITMPPLFEWEDEEDGIPSYEIQHKYWKYMYNTASKYDYVTVLDLFSLNPFHYPCMDCFDKYFADSLHLNERGYRESFPYLDNVLTALLGEEKLH